MTMTSVLKAESLAGENYETMVEGARSLVTGLGSILRVTSFGAKAHDSQYPHQDSSNYRRRRSTTNGTSLVSDIFVKRQKRSAINETFDEKLQVLKWYEFRVWGNAWVACYRRRRQDMISEAKGKVPLFPL